MTQRLSDNSRGRSGVTFGEGYQASGVAAGIKPSGAKDLCVLLSERPAVVAGAFTANRVAAATVAYDRDIVAGGAPVRAVVVNSGNANAATGANGMADTVTMAECVAAHVGVSSNEVLVSSTGKIGVPLPMSAVQTGIAAACDRLAASGGPDAAEAIMTTDTVPKAAQIELDIEGRRVRLGGMAKGAGMIAPHLIPAAVPHATMLAYLTTDAAVERDFLQQCLCESLDRSFNRITIDGDCSTNDTFLALANGAAGNSPLTARHPAAEAFAAAFADVAASLARQIVLDAEGATRFVEVVVQGARDSEHARKCAAKIANSMLCKTAWFGGDPNWGRIIDAAGYSGADLDAEGMSLDYGDTPVVRNGVDAGTPAEELARAVAGPELRVRLDLGVGAGSFTMWTCDLSYEYVRINAEYST